MKACVLRPLAREDRRAEVQHDRKEAGASVAAKLVEELAKAQRDLAQNPAIGSPTMGKALGIDGLWTWRVNGFPLSLWYFERADHLEVVRLVGQRPQQSDIEI